MRNKLIFFNDRFGLTRKAIRGEITFARFPIDENPHDQYLPYTPGQVVMAGMNYKDLLHFSERTLAIMTDRNGLLKKYQKESYGEGWEDKMKVNADLMPFRIRIKDTRVERLQDISEREILSSGVIANVNRSMYALRDETIDLMQVKIYATAREAYAALIDDTYGKGTWERNPAVIAVEFESLDAELSYPKNPLTEEQRKRLSDKKD